MNIKTWPVRIRHVAAYLPETILDNDGIMRQMGAKGSGALLYRAVGSKEKRVAGKEEMGSDLLVRIGKQLLKETGEDASDIDKLICSCDPPDHAAPDTAVVTQAKIGLSCPAFGVSMSCVGWLCGLNIASHFLMNGDRKILVLSASTVGSKYFFNNPMHRAIFGDGAGGALVEKVDNEKEGQIIRIDLLTLGQFYKNIFAPNPWTAVPEEIPEAYKNSFYMHHDNQVFFSALDAYIKPFYEKQYQLTGLKGKDISLFIVHQASMPLFNYTLQSFNIPRDKVVDNFAKCGNTISAELPIYLDEAMRQKRIKKGDIVYFLTYGAGFTAGAMLFRV